MHLSKAARCVVTDLAALLLTVGLSIFATLHSHIPAALTFIQVIAIELLVLAWPTAYFTRGKGTSKPRHDNAGEAFMEMSVFAVLAATLSYGNYLLFYSRHNIDPAYMDHANPLHLQATTLTLTTLALCELVNVRFLQIESKKHVFRKSSFDPELMKRLGLAVGILLVIAYFPLAQSVFGTKDLALSDWLAIVFCVAVYAGFRLLQRQTSQHSRHAVIRLHKEVNKTK